MVSEVGRRFHALKGATIELEALTRIGEACKPFVDELVARRAEAKALLAQIQTETSAALRGLETVQLKLTQTQAQLAQAERQLLDMRNHIAEEKAALHKLADEMTKGRAA